MSAHDPFEPRHEPAKSLYLAFQEAAKRRKELRVEEWVVFERQAVLNKAIELAQSMGLRAPTPEEVERAERYAMGSADYGTKWAYQVAECMQPKKDVSR